MEEVRLGTIGSGVIVRAILNSVARIEGIRLEAVYSRTREKGAELAGEYGCDKVYTDMDTFLADDNINTVYIATPNLLHYEQVRRALLAGKHVICEKPFTTLAANARELAALAKARGLFLMEAAPTTFLPNYRVLVRELPKIGRVRLVLSNYSQYSSRYDLVLRGERPNIFNPEYGGGCLMDINYYNVLLNVVLFGRPRKAVYYCNRYPGLADTSGVMVMQYDDFVSQNAGAKDTWGVNSFQIEGEKGFIYIENGANGLARIRVATKTSDVTFNEQPDPDRYYYEIQEMTRLLRAEDSEGIYDRLDGTLAAVDVLEAARREAGIVFPGDS